MQRLLARSFIVGIPSGASFFHPISECKHVGEAEVDSLCVKCHYCLCFHFWCVQILGRHQEFSAIVPSSSNGENLAAIDDGSTDVAKARTLPHRPTFVACAIRTWSRERFGGWSASQCVPFRASLETAPMACAHRHLLCLMCRFASFSP